MRFPLFNSVAMVLLLVVFVCVDQMMDVVTRFKMTRLPSLDTISSGVVVSMTGL
jgi:hypothetical protein